MNEELNKLIHEWLGKCWHERAVDPKGTGGFKVKMRCEKCGDSRYRSYCVSDNPDYTTDATACLTLIEAVRAKGHRLEIRSWPDSPDIPKYWVYIFDRQGLGLPVVYESSLPMAVAQAVVKLISETEGENGI